MKPQDVYFVDGVRTPFGKAGEKGVYWNTRADDLIVKAMIGLLERHPDLDRAAIDDVAIAATTPAGRSGLNYWPNRQHIGRSSRKCSWFCHRSDVCRRDDRCNHDRKLNRNRSI